jgi:lycopene beta-cyclase
MHAKNYDFIFFGAGCASLSIIMRMIESKKFEEKKILLIDKEPKLKNDRTWCFWEEEAGYFEDLVFHNWDELLFKISSRETINLELGKYRYKMIRGIDFYKKCFSQIELQKNIDSFYGEILFEEKGGRSKIKINGEPLIIDDKTILFNSIIRTSVGQKGKFHLLQHFKGWVIETHEPFFKPNQATIMDFSVDQIRGTTFAYILPTSEKKALIEYTLFSEKLLSEKEYDNQLKAYIEKLLGPLSYDITEEEFGIIPMTNKNFPTYKNGIYFIGTAGGQTKASTGYTFRFIQKQAGEIVSELISDKFFSQNKKTKKRFIFYDSTLLHILSNNLLEGKIIFSKLFKKNRADLIFKFLDNETSISEEIGILNTLPKIVFLKAGFIELKKMIFNRKKS